MKISVIEAFEIILDFHSSLYQVENSGWVGDDLLQRLDLIYTEDDCSYYKATLERERILSKIRSALTKSPFTEIANLFLNSSKVQFEVNSVLFSFSIR